MKGYRTSDGRPRSLPDTDKAVLEPFSKALGGLYDLINSLSHDDRLRLREAADHTSESNCSWIEYDAATLALEYLRLSEPKSATEGQR